MLCCDFAAERMMVASPRSPILTSPEDPLMKMLSLFRSRWITGGLCPWRYIRPLRIWNAQRLTTRGSRCLCFFRYLGRRDGMDRRDGGARGRSVRLLTA